MLELAEYFTLRLASELRNWDGLGRGFGSFGGSSASSFALHWDSFTVWIPDSFNVWSPLRCLVAWKDNENPTTRRTSAPLDFFRGKKHSNWIISQQGGKKKKKRILFFSFLLFSLSPKWIIEHYHPHNNEQIQDCIVDSNNLNCIDFLILWLGFESTQNPINQLHLKVRIKSILWFELVIIRCWMLVP